jgi:RecG-like helicase
MNVNVSAAGRPRLEARTLVQFLPGVGPGRAALLGRLGIVSIEDLLFHVPREYLDARRTVKIAGIPHAGLVTVVVKVDAVETRRAGGRVDLAARVSDDSGMLAVRWFGQGFLAREIVPGAAWRSSASCPGPGRTFSIRCEVIEEPEDANQPAGRILPRHPLTAGVARALRRWVRAALDAVKDELAAQDPCRLRCARRSPCPGSPRRSRRSTSGSSRMPNAHALGSRLTMVLAAQLVLALAACAGAELARWSRRRAWRGRARRSRRCRSCRRRRSAAR